MQQSWCHMVRVRGKAKPKGPRTNLLETITALLRSTHTVTHPYATAPSRTSGERASCSSVARAFPVFARPRIASSACLAPSTPASAAPSSRSLIGFPALEAP